MPTRAALLLIGHGSNRYPDAGETLLRHTEALREQGYHAAAGFLNGPPTILDAIQTLGNAVIRAVPFFMEDGYFTRIAIPRALPGATLDLCPPIGLHATIPDLIEKQALAAAAFHRLHPADTALLVIGHGSATDPGQPLTLHRHTTALAARDLFARTDHACLEEAPFVADILAEMRHQPVIVIGYFANHGGHVRHDVPALLETERGLRKPQGPTIHFAGNVTDDPAMIRIILDQAGFPPFAAGE